MKRGTKGSRTGEKKQIATLLEEGPAEIQDYLASLNDSLRGKFESGEYGLGDLDFQAVRWKEDREERKRAARAESKAALKSTIIEALKDGIKEGSKNNHLPECMLMTATGELLLFRRTRAAVRYGRESGARHMIMKFDRASITLVPGAEDW
ncbi:MAG: hypothetical protein Q7R22_011370 [Verrucomicrobiota bacterium JB025]|nr:hypothetical protein [Verrucomicrobiota bacterium JB025]